MTDVGIPTLVQVAALVASRTKGEFVELGTFSGETRPTDVQVQDLIERSARQVYLRVGAYQRIPPVPADGGVDLQAAAVDLVALRASLWVEQSFFPEQVKSDRSPYQQLYQAWMDDLAALVQAVQEALANPEGPQAGEDVGVYAQFPAAPLPYGSPFASGERAPGCDSALPGGWVGWL